LRLPVLLLHHRLAVPIAEVERRIQDRDASTAADHPRCFGQHAVQVQCVVESGVEYGEVERSVPEGEVGEGRGGPGEERRSRGKVGRRGAEAIHRVLPDVDRDGPMTLECGAVAQPAIPRAQVDAVQGRRLPERCGAQHATDESVEGALSNRPLRPEGTGAQVGEGVQSFHFVTAALACPMRGVLGAEAGGGLALVQRVHVDASGARSTSRRTKSKSRWSPSSANGRLTTRSAASRRERRDGCSEIQGSAALGGTKTPIPRRRIGRNQGAKVVTIWRGRWYRTVKCRPPRRAGTSPVASRRNPCRGVPRNSWTITSPGGSGPKSTRRSRAPGRRRRENPRATGSRSMTQL